MQALLLLFYMTAPPSVKQFHPPCCGILRLLSALQHSFRTMYLSLSANSDTASGNYPVLYSVCSILLSEIVQDSHALSSHLSATSTRTSSNFRTSSLLADLSVFPSLICDFCPSDQEFAYSFLQIPPHDGHPCCSAIHFLVA